MPRSGTGTGFLATTIQVPLKSSDVKGHLWAPQLGVQEQDPIVPRGLIGGI